ncbi:hypothetical protein Tco_0568391 [Tanacetum coccineum]
MSPSDVVINRNKIRESSGGEEERDDGSEGVVTKSKFRCLNWKIGDNWLRPVHLLTVAQSSIDRELARWSQPGRLDHSFGGVRGPRRKGFKLVKMEVKHRQKNLTRNGKDFVTRFVPQIELSAEQAFWSKNYVNSLDSTLSSRPTKVEVPKELLKVSMVNTSLKKLKYHLAGFDVVVKERTIPTAIIEGLLGFEHTKACFRDEIIPFVKALKDLFNTFNQYLIDELFEVQNVFHQIEQAVEQHHNASVNVHECEKCLKLESELLNKKDFVEKEIYNKLFKSFTTLAKH